MKPKFWEEIAMEMLECNLKKLRKDYPLTWSQLNHIATLVNRAGGELRSRQIIAAVIVFNQ